MRVVAIDGPGGAGKSTVAQALADRLGLDYLDTGAMYRGVAHAVLRDGLDPADEAAVAQKSTETDVEVVPGGVMVDGEDATEAIRGPAVTQAVSAVAANPAVRDVLRERQRDWVTAHGGGVVEGRDIGTVVFPEADLKVYLTASAEVRAARRAGESGAVDTTAVAQDLERRDHHDSTRTDSPLRQAPNALVIDTDDLTVEEIVDDLVARLA